MAYKELELVIWEVASIIYITLSFVFGILILFYGYQFYKLRHKLIIKKRYSKIVLIILALDLLLLFIT